MQAVALFHAATLAWFCSAVDIGLGASKGVFVTTSAFSAHAIDFASRIPQRVVLINGKRLTELMVDHGVGVRISRTVEFKRLDEDFFSEEE
jgi:restriction system protein